MQLWLYRGYYLLTCSASIVRSGDQTGSVSGKRPSIALYYGKLLRDHSIHYWDFRASVIPRR